MVKMQSFRNTWKLEVELILGHEFHGYFGALKYYRAFLQYFLSDTLLGEHDVSKLDEFS